MELGQKLKQARLEAGLSQRQLCGDIITRNMLSQIENGSARPSLATIQALSARLGKPVSYFWEDAPCENLGILHRAQQENCDKAMEILQDYLPDDPMLDCWYYQLLTRCCIQLAEKALEEGRKALAQTLLQQAQDYGAKTPDFDGFFRQRIALLQYRAGSLDALSAIEKLSDNTDIMLLRATAALAQQNPHLCLSCLAAADRKTNEVLLLQADAWMALGSYKEAAQCYCQLEKIMGKEIYSRLEICYRELGDFQKAYEYACKQR